MATVLPVMRDTELLDELLDSLQGTSPTGPVDAAWLNQQLGREADGVEDFVTLARQLGWGASPIAGATHHPFPDGPGKDILLGEKLVRLYRPIFRARRDAHRLDDTALCELIGRVLGSPADDPLVRSTAATLRILAARAVPEYLEKAQRADALWLRQSSVRWLALKIAGLAFLVLPLAIGLDAAGVMTAPVTSWLVFAFVPAVVITILNSMTANSLIEEMVYNLLFTVLLVVVWFRIDNPAHLFVVPAIAIGYWYGTITRRL